MSIAEPRQGHIEQFEKCIHGYLQEKKVVHKAVEEVRERKYVFFLVRMGLSKGRGLFPTHLKLKRKFWPSISHSEPATPFDFFPHWNFF